MRNLSLSDRVSLNGHVDEISCMRAGRHGGREGGRAGGV